MECCAKEWFHPRPGTSGHPPRKIVGAHEVWMPELIKTPFTLRGLVEELAERALRVDYRTVWSFVHRTGYSFKRRPKSPRSKTARMQAAVARACDCPIAGPSRQRRADPERRTSGATGRPSDARRPAALAPRRDKKQAAVIQPDRETLKCGVSPEEAHLRYSADSITELK